MHDNTKSGVAFYEGSSWYHRAKVIDEFGKIKYTKRRGFRTKEEAEQSYYEYEEAFKKASRASQMKQPSNEMLNIGFTDYLQYWFEDVYSERIENTTRMVGAYTLYDMILPNIEKDIKLRYVNTEYLNELLYRVAGISKSSGNKCRELLSIALKEALANGYVKSNPVENTKTYPRSKPQVLILTKEKIKVLLNVAADSPWYLEILLALFCGLRKGEIIGLKAEDIDYQAGTVHIQRQITSNPIIKKGSSDIEEYIVEEKEPKTANSDRILKLPSEIVEELREREELIDKWKVKCGSDYHDNGYISCQENGLPHATSAMNNALSKMCKRNGLPHITVHGLRHMYATILLEQGVSLVKISALLGHSSVNTTFEYYCDQMDENNRIMAFMNNTFVPEENVS